VANDENGVDLDLLAQVTTATLSNQMLARGARRSFMEGIVPLDPEMKIVGRARTIRYLPLRGPAAEVRPGGEGNIQRISLEAIQPGEILVADGGGDIDGGGMYGDILAARLQYLGCVGLVVDGAVRDTGQILDVGLPVWTRGVHGGAMNRGLFPADYDLPIRCGGATVLPGDYIVGDADGVCVVPPEVAAQIAIEGAAIEHKESFIRAKVMDEGYASTEAYPPNDKVLAEYEEYKKDNPV